ncbi:hypothetical protein C7974DRAFT_371637 [Boeremia exigua]|uniref:uncharacterized protein n=1 Tax=Boeremia exigua TaxID=749465 RepID=UPI001E8D42D5|nr:uncharacterized protein C7974DRAFT_371637 [Boeremia exigua]KAH6644524.1 hypothetical protein C7974DRAFT_371637 [Boeremia exigua]
MSSLGSRDYTPAHLSLVGHSDVPAGQSCQSTDASTPEELVRQRLTDIPRLSQQVELSPEPIPSAVLDSASDASTITSTTDHPDMNTLHNSFAAAAARRACARAREQEQDDVQANGSQSYTAHDQRSTQLGDDSESVRSSIHDTPARYYSPLEVETASSRNIQNVATHDHDLQGETPGQIHQGPASPSNPMAPCLPQFYSSAAPEQASVLEDILQDYLENDSEPSDTGATVSAPSDITTYDYLPSSPILHARSRGNRRVHIPQPDFQAMPSYPSRLAPQTMHAEHDSEGLPPRPEPGATTTIDRFQRRFRSVFSRSNPAVDEGMELSTLSRASVSYPRLFRDGEAAAMRTQEQEQQRENDGLQIETQQTQQQHVSIWIWLGFVLGGLAMFVLIYSLVTWYGR